MATTRRRAGFSRLVSVSVVLVASVLSLLFIVVVVVVVVESAAEGSAFGARACAMFVGAFSAFASVAPSAGAGAAACQQTLPGRCVVRSGRERERERYIDR